MTVAMTDQTALTPNPSTEISASASHADSSTDKATDSTSIPITAPCTIAPQTDAPTDKLTVADAPSTEGRRRSWLTDTLHAIVERALTADKPDIKGALAALAMLAETDETATATDDIATVIRDARRRAHDAANRQ